MSCVFGYVIVKSDFSSFTHSVKGSIALFILAFSETLLITFPFCGCPKLISYPGPTVAYTLHFRKISREGEVLIFLFGEQRKHSDNENILDRTNLDVGYNDSFLSCEFA